VKDAIHDAKNLRKFLLVYVFCNDNPLCQSMDSLYKSTAISRIISSRYIFYPTSSTTWDGYSIATGFSFTALPLFLFLRPTGETVNDCQLFADLRGAVSEETLLATLSVAVPPAAADPIRDAQDREFLEAEAADARRTQELFQAQTTETQAVDERERIEREFAALPELAASDRDVLICKFKFPDNTEKVRVFRREGSVAMLYAFVRYFRFPEEFVLRTQFPMLEIPDDGSTIADIFRETSIVIHVVDE
jgi:hypothetical protein